MLAVSGPAIIVTCLALISIGAMSFYASLQKNPVPGTRWFGLLSVSLAAWIGFNAISDIQTENSVWWVRAGYVAVVLAVYSLDRFGHLFSDRKATIPLLHWSHAVFAGFVAALSLTPSIVLGVEFSRGIANVIPGPLYALFIAYTVTVLPWTLYRLWDARTNVRVIRRKQINYIVGGAAFLGAVTVVTNVIMPWIFGNNLYYWVSSLASLGFVGASMYAIARRQLFDVKSAIIRTVTYAMVVVALIFIYMFIIASGLGELFGMNRLTEAEQTSLMMLILLFGLTTPPLVALFNRLTNTLFYKGTYDTNKFIAVFNRKIVMAKHLREMLLSVLGEMALVSKTNYAAIILWTENQEPQVFEHGKKRKVAEKDLAVLESYARQGVSTMVEYGAESDVARVLSKHGWGLISAIVSQRKVHGVLVLGEKLDGVYTQKDIELMDTICDELSIAVENMIIVEEVTSLNSTLKERVNEATKELRQSNLRLMELDKTKDEFISMASHQLRTPLTSVKGYVSMVLEGDAGEVSSSQRKLLEEAYASSERMVHLIGDFLNVSRIQTGKFMLERHEVDLSDVVRQEVEGMKQIANSHGVPLKYRKPKVFPRLYLDEGKLRQVIMNLIDNAIYYSPDGTPVEVESTIEEGSAIVRIIDHGMGVPKEAQAKLFTKFFRASNARTQRPDGTGVGLFLAKKVILEHGGTLIFESVEGKGSTFGFRLPIKKLSNPPKEEYTDI